ncbi:hypothetical protein [Paraburkholderia sp. BCC1885]|uniref:hypothetical protein n=1 Tax=Paraburkholderia sp. BCC1885 TaxID=2562669 RepID=UPI001182D0CB|nr:hypothetical protein [Paraburkholderia sp. BCC1885]
MSQWNTLSVPLENGWQCTLMSASQYDSSPRQALRFLRNDVGVAALEDDRRDFDRYFRPRWDRRTVSGAAELGEIRAFLSDVLNVVHWNLPTDDAAVEYMLRQAVALGQLVPLVNRECRSPGRASRPTPAPLRWLSSGGSQIRPAFRSADRALSTIGDGSILTVLHDPATQGTEIIGARGVTTASDGGGAPALLRDAQAFEYREDAASGESNDIAGMPFNGTPGSWISSMPGTMPQMRRYGQEGTPLVDFDLEAHHGNPNPHAHNWIGYDRDEGAPVSLLP